MELARRLHRLPDGRDLELVVDDSTPSTDALVLVTGAPWACLPYPPAVEVARDRRLTYLSIARPGYGRSTRKPNRTMADFAIDLAEVADALELRRLFLFGWSMGGPHALAAAAALPELVAAAASVAGLAPHREDGVDWRDEIGADAVRERLEAAPAFAAHIRDGIAELPTTPDEMRAGLTDVVEADRVAATDEVLAFYVAAFRDGTSAGFWGWHDDVVACVRPWGVDLGSTRGPVTLWHGSGDWLAPPRHAEWLAQAIPGARLHVLEGEGHISVPVIHLEEIVEELLTLAERKPAGE